MVNSIVNSKLFAVIISSVISVLLFVVTQQITAKRENTKILDDKLSKKADIVYVDNTIQPIRDQLKTHIENDDKRWEMLFDRILSIEQKQTLVLDHLMNKK